MDAKRNEARPRRSYEKPRVRTIGLLVEEVLGVGCKNSSLTASGNVSGCRLTTSCISNGS
jgi:hypothetical protein